MISKDRCQCNSCLLLHIMEQDTRLEELQDIITVLRETNRMLCRELDEAQQAYERATGVHTG